MDLFNYSSSPFIPGFDIGNMMAFASPETLVANMANRKKLIEQRSKNREEPIEQSPKVNNYILNKFEKFGRFLGGIPSQEEVEQIRKNNPQMDIFKTDTQLKKEGKVRNEQGNVVNADTGVITKSGNKVIPLLLATICTKVSKLVALKASIFCLFSLLQA